MNIRYGLILAISIASLLGGCTTGDEGDRNAKHAEKLMHHRDWPRIEQIAKTEVKKREVAWPDNATYLPEEHTDKGWVVWAMTATPNGDLQRKILLLMGDDGRVMMYKRYTPGER